jgi:hypothetical protein
MKKKLGEFKLVLKTERLRNLSAGEAKNVVGGGDACPGKSACFNAASAGPPPKDEV